MEYIDIINDMECTDRILGLKKQMLDEPRYATIEQALIITHCYKQNEKKPRIIQRANCLKASLENISIRIDDNELIVGNRTSGVRGGVIFPETGISWVSKEFETLPTRPQDKFHIHPEDVVLFNDEILPYWEGRTLEDKIKREIGEKIDGIASAVKINQKDHSQGHICPGVKKWLMLGPKNIMEDAKNKAMMSDSTCRDFYTSVATAMEGACNFILRYAALASVKARQTGLESLNKISSICGKLSSAPPVTFWDAVQSVWFLFVILQMEGNASSFSPGRMDQYLYPYFLYSKSAEGLKLSDALEIIEALWLKFNQIVYLRNSNSARYFAGFPIGFNVLIGGQNTDGSDAANELSYLFLKASGHLGLPQPNLSCRVYEGSPQPLLEACARVIGRGLGMPQLFNDRAVIPALKAHGVSAEDAANYAVVGCVELSTHGNSLGWSDAAMFNMVKVLELTLNDGFDMLTGKRAGISLGSLVNYETYNRLEEAFAEQIVYFMDKMAECIAAVEAMHEKLLPTPFLSAVIDDCMENGKDVTQGGARYNFTGVQAIQIANVADSLAAIKLLVYEKKVIGRKELLEAMRDDFQGNEIMRQMLLNKAPKYGNGIDYVDTIAAKWVSYFADKLTKYRNNRNGIYQMGLYTVSAHVPMGENVAASADGRHSRAPLADGGVSPMYGRDRRGPTALIHSVSRLDYKQAGNGALLNMKFLPSFFQSEEGIQKFAYFIRGIVLSGISHVQFNVINKSDLIAAQKEPEKYRGLTVRVAGYTAYFTELDALLQNEIIERTSYMGV